MRRFFNYHHVTTRSAKVNTFVPFLAIQNQYHCNAPRDENPNNTEHKNMRKAFLWFFNYALSVGIGLKYIACIHRDLDQQEEDRKKYLAQKYDAMSLEDLKTHLLKGSKLEGYIISVNALFFNFQRGTDDEICALKQHEAFPFFYQKCKEAEEVEEAERKEKREQWKEYKKECFEFYKNKPIEELAERLYGFQGFETSFEHLFCGDFHAHSTTELCELVDASEALMAFGVKYEELLRSSDSHRSAYEKYIGYSNIGHSSSIKR